MIYRGNRLVVATSTRIPNRFLLIEKHCLHHNIINSTVVCMGRTRTQSFTDLLLTCLKCEKVLRKSWQSTKTKTSDKVYKSPILPHKSISMCLNHKMELKMEPSQTFYQTAVNCLKKKLQSLIWIVANLLGLIQTYQTPKR